jgi:hypothetical protein
MFRSWVGDGFGAAGELVASGESFWWGSGVAELDCAGGALVVAHVLGQGDCRLTVTDAVDVGDGGFDLGLFGVAA